MGAALETVEAELTDMGIACIERVMENRAGGNLIRSLMAVVGGTLGGTNIGIGTHKKGGRKGKKTREVAQRTTITAPGFPLK